MADDGAFPSFAERLAEWNALADELDRLHEEYRQEPRAKKAMIAMLRARGVAREHMAHMTCAIVHHSCADRPDEAGDQVRLLRWYVERFARALALDSTQRGKRRSFGPVEPPSVQLDNMIEKIREEYPTQPYFGRSRRVSDGVV
jgi:hypothetical protein